MFCMVLGPNKYDTTRLGAAAGTEYEDLDGMVHALLLSAYTLATQSPVLTARVVLSACVLAVYGTNTAHGATTFAFFALFSLLMQFWFCYQIEVFVLEARYHP